MTDTPDIAGLRAIAEALDAYRTYIDASDLELLEQGLDRDDLLRRARELDPYDGETPTAVALDLAEKAGADRVADLRRLVVALGLPDCARPESPAAVFEECLERITILRAKAEGREGSI